MDEETTFAVADDVYCVAVDVADDHALLSPKRDLLLLLLLHHFHDHSQSNATEADDILSPPAPRVDQDAVQTWMEVHYHC